VQNLKHIQKKLRQLLTQQDSRFVVEYDIFTIQYNIRPIMNQRTPGSSASRALIGQQWIRHLYGGFTVNL